MDSRVKDALLNAWMSMALNIRGNRILSNLSFNEIVVCSILYRNMQEDKPMLTATDLCNDMKLLKSQLNRELNLLEERGLIERIRSDKDKRKVFIKLREDNLSVYLEEHEKVMYIVHNICMMLGEEKAKELTMLLHQAVDIVNKCRAEYANEDMS